MVIPFISFKGECEEAISFYEKIFNIQRQFLMRYKEMPNQAEAKLSKKEKELIAHAEIIVNDTLVWFADSRGGVSRGNQVTLAVGCKTPEEVFETCSKLREGGKFLMKPEKTFYSPMFGVVQDKFGVIWNIICQ